MSHEFLVLVENFDKPFLFDDGFVFQQEPGDLLVRGHVLFLGKLFLKGLDWFLWVIEHFNLLIGQYNISDWPLSQET